MVHKCLPPDVVDTILSHFIHSETWGSRPAKTRRDEWMSTKDLLDWSCVCRTWTVSVRQRVFRTVNVALSSRSPRDAPLILNFAHSLRAYSWLSEYIRSIVIKYDARASPLVHTLDECLHLLPYLASVQLKGYSSMEPAEFNKILHILPAQISIIRITDQRSVDLENLPIFLADHPHVSSLTFNRI
ncbi:hypothetical protein BT69DRAFT_618708 [Atractiella rhizophila]|nr:hypothetical protein BT69DRAFT_618708 [Atractiella rhizophila]